MKTYQIKSVKNIPQEDIDDIVATALEGGITHWCDRAVTTVDQEDNYLSDMLTRSGSLELHDRHENKWHTLELDKLLSVLGEVDFDFDNYDSIDADSVVQRAVFGEVIYG